MKTNREHILEKWSRPERQAISRAIDNWTGFNQELEDDASTDEQLDRNEKLLFFMLREAERIKSQHAVLDKDSVEYTLPDDILSSTLSDLAHHFLSRGDDIKALPFAERALLLRENVVSVCDDEYDEIALCLADLYTKLHLHEDLEELSLKHVSALEKLHGADSPEIDYALHGLAQAYEEQGKFPEALAVAERIVAINSKAYGDLDARTVEVRRGLKELIEDPAMCLCTECGYSLSLEPQGGNG